MFLPLCMALHPDAEIDAGAQYLQLLETGTDSTSCVSVIIAATVVVTVMRQASTVINISSILIIMFVSVNKAPISSKI